jgi:probable rRNA maturation factor
MGNAVFIFGSGSKYRREAGKIKSLANKLVKSVKMAGLSFEVYLISDREMRRLNLKFRGMDKPTNILSFNADKGSVRPDLKKNARYLGEIFLAPGYIRSQGENPSFLFIHGFLHLLGYTHNGKRDTIKMEKLEGRLSKKLKI